MSTTMPRMIVGIASTRYSHFQPARPNRPLSSISPVDIGAPAATATGSAREKPPGHHDARDPYARAEFFHNDVAWYLEQEIAPKKDAGGKPKRRGVEAEVLVHGERREAHVNSIEVAKEIAQGCDRQHAQIHLAHSRLLDTADHRFLSGMPCRFADVSCNITRRGRPAKAGCPAPRVRSFPDKESRG